VSILAAAHQVHRTIL